MKKVYLGILMAFLWIFGSERQLNASDVDELEDKNCVTTAISVDNYKKGNSHRFSFFRASDTFLEESKTFIFQSLNIVNNYEKASNHQLSVYRADEANIDDHSTPITLNPGKNHFIFGDSYRNFVWVLCHSGGVVEKISRYAASVTLSKSAEGSLAWEVMYRTLLISKEFLS